MRAHGYRELVPPLVDGDGHMRGDAMVALARTHAAGGEIHRFARRMMLGPIVDAAFTPGRFREPAFEVACGAIFGVVSPMADAEMCAMLLALGGDPGLASAEVAVNTVGELSDTRRYLDEIAELLPLRCPTCQAASDPLRFFSCDEEGCRALAAAAPPIRQSASTPALKHHEGLLATLQVAGVTVKDEPRLAFGAGKYGRTIVELRARAADGTTLAVARGGRRDHVLEPIGIRFAPAVGVTIGLLRASLCVTPDGASFEHACEIFIAAQGAGARAWAFRVAAAERARGFRVDVDLTEGGWADQLARADAVRARVVVVCGEVERKAGEVALRDMHSRQTRRVPETSLAAELKRLLR